MSAPNTNIDRQERRHRPAIWGITIALLIALVAMIGFGAWNGLPAEERAAPATVDAEQ